MSYLGLDLGTSGLRALLVGDDGQPIGAVERHYTSQHPHFGWSEQDPEDWISALEAAFDELNSTYPEFSRLQSIGVAGHMHGATLLDAKGDVIRPCILWNDTRAHEEAAFLDQIPAFRDVSGNIVFPGFTAPKLLWVKKNEPENFKRIAKVLLPAAYLNYYLTGDCVADMSDSAGTSWLDVGKREWSPSLLGACELDLSHMPRLVEGVEVAGVLRAELAQRWGLDSKVVIAGGAGDNAAAACGIGALEEGTGFLSLGTSGVLLAARDDYFPAPESALHTFCHAIPSRWYQMGVMLSATDCLNWLSNMVGHSPAQLTKAVGEELQVPGRVMFLPYLSGERTPHNDANIRGSFTGLGVDTSREDLTRAVLEGVAFGLRDSHAALKSTKANMDSLIAIGGGAQSPYWLELIATVLNVNLEIPEDGEFGAALGAARLAHIAASGAALEDVLKPPKIAHTVAPNTALSAYFDETYENFTSAYHKVKAV